MANTIASLALGESEADAYAQWFSVLMPTYNNDTIEVVSAAAVAELFKTSLLPTITLKEIWGMVPRQNDAWFSRVEFYNAVRLIAHAQDKRKPSMSLVGTVAPLPRFRRAELASTPITPSAPYPPPLSVSSPPPQPNQQAPPLQQINTPPPAERVARAAKHAGFPRGAFDPSGLIVRASEKQLYDELFDILSPNKEPIPGEIVRDFLLSSKLQPAVLSSIWHLSDMDDDGALSHLELCIAVHLVLLKKGGMDLPVALPDEFLSSLQSGGISEEESSSTKYVPQVLKSISQFSAAKDSSSEVRGVDPFNQEPHGSTLQHATRDRPSLRGSRRLPSSSSSSKRKSLSQLNDAWQDSVSSPVVVTTNEFQVDFAAAFGSTAATAPQVAPTPSSPTVASSPTSLTKSIASPPIPSPKPIVPAKPTSSPNLALSSATTTATFFPLISSSKSSSAILSSSPTSSPTSSAMTQVVTSSSKSTAAAAAAFQVDFESAFGAQDQAVQRTMSPQPLQTGSSPSSGFSKSMSPPPTSPTVTSSKASAATTSTEDSQPSSSSRQRGSSTSSTGSHRRAISEDLNKVLQRAAVEERERMASHRKSVMLPTITSATEEASSPTDSPIAIKPASRRYMQRAESDFAGSSSSASSSSVAIIPTANGTITSPPFTLAPPPPRAIPILSKRNSSLPAMVTSTTTSSSSGDAVQDAIAELREALTVLRIELSQEQAARRKLEAEFAAFKSKFSLQ